MASDFKWIKITTDIFDDEKILLIESLPDAYAIITVWFKLLCLAGKQNNSGVFMMGKIAYTDKMLATIFRMKESTVAMALQTFEQFGMVEIIDGVITIPNWNKHQTLDAYEKKKERDRIYQAERRANQRMLVEKSSDIQTTQSSDVAISDIDIEEDKEKEIDIITTSNDVVCSTDVQSIVAAWNALGLSQITKLVSGTKRHQMLKARIKEYGTASILEAIGKISSSDFLMGRTGDGWTITFDWFIRPNNFPKVLDGNYQNKSKGGRKEIVPAWMSEQERKEEQERYLRDLERANAELRARREEMERNKNSDLSERVEKLKQRLQE